MARVEMEGLQPGERLSISFSAEVAGTHSRRVEIWSSDPVGADGHFVYEEPELRSLPGSASNHWKIQIVHLRGVACTEVTLP